MTGAIDIRTMGEADVEIAIDWAAAEGWNPGLRDAALFYAADPAGFLVAVDGGEIVAMISVVRYGADFGFLGLYIVRPDRRGRGIGWRLWTAGIEHLAGRTIGLDGVVAQQENYRRSGFAFAHRTIRCSGQFSGIAAGHPRRDPRVREVRPSDLGAIGAFDAVHFGASRNAFLSGWLTAAGHAAFVAEEDGEILGYGVLRPCRSGAKIGPLFAATPVLAETLFATLAAACVPGEPLVLDVPEPNAEAIAMALRHGLSPIFETARMYRGQAPSLPLCAIYGITSFELG